ncbi:MAG: AIR synthase-related protein [Thermoplasmata archaeon]|nr:AIR synthase-related protein [Thermoplasmata archaeon]
MADPSPPARKLPPNEGKISPSFFERAIRPHLGRRRRDVVVGPRTGVDVGVVRLPEDGVLLSTTDPLYIEPRLGWERAAWFAFHIIASDLTTTGRRPDWATIDLAVPPGTTDRILETILRVFDREARRLGTAIVTGHTGRYSGCAFPIAGSGTMLASAAAESYVTTRAIPAGAVLLFARTVALEATGMLATFFPEKIQDHLGRATLQQARAFTAHMSTVPDALRAAAVGLRTEGVWAMHDATEGGVRTAAWEMAVASGRGLIANLSAAWIDPTVREVADLFGMNPLDASSEGTLLLAVDPGRVSDVTSALKSGGAVVSRLGQFTSRPSVVRDGARPLRPPARDSFWAVVREQENARPPG